METFIEIMIYVLSALIGLLVIAAFVMSIYLAIKYLKYNKQIVKSKKIGHVVAEELLKDNNITNIKVKRTSLMTSFMFGNSYSHYFKKIRLRGLIYNKASLTSVALAGEKVGLAILDKNNDKDMKRRIRLTPIIDFGPLLFILMIIVGLVVDILLYGTVGIITVIVVCCAFLFYVWTFLLALSTLKTEKKAQTKALKMLKDGNYLTDSEINDAKELYKLYNINYMLAVIISLLEMIKEVLKIVLTILKNVKKSN